MKGSSKEVKSLKRILEASRRKLDRELSVKEVASLSKPRTLSDYEELLAYISEADQVEFEGFLKSLRKKKKQRASKNAHVS